MSQHLEFHSSPEWKAKARRVPRGALTHDAVLKGVAPQRVKTVDQRQQITEFVISTAGVDRENDTIALDGWDLSSYQRNPVVLFAHDHAQPVVGRALQTWTEGGALRSRCQFTPRDLNPLGATLFALYDAGYMRATSVGFRPTQWRFAEAREAGVDFLAQELLEYSLVAVPANAEALMAATAKGIDTAPLAAWSAQVLDRLGPATHGPAPLRTYLEQLRRVCDPGQRRQSRPADQRQVLVLDDEAVGTRATPPGRQVLRLDDVDLPVTPAQVRDLMRDVVRAAVTQQTGWLGD